MRFIKSKDFNLSNGTSRIGTLRITYSQLLAKLGEPCFGPEHSGDGKVRAEWLLQFEDGSIATIYDYKEYETPIEKVTEWSIGGRKRRDCYHVFDSVDVAAEGSDFNGPYNYRPEEA